MKVHSVYAFGRCRRNARKPTITLRHPVNQGAHRRGVAARCRRGLALWRHLHRSSVRSSRRLMRARVVGIAMAAAAAAGTLPVVGQSVQYRSAAGTEYRSMADTGAIARAQTALNADPRSIPRVIALGIAQSGARQFREAIETFTRGMQIEPNNAMLYRW